MTDTALLDAPPQQQEGSESQEPPNKYLYREFMGYEGERRLKSILKKILPMALYRTWETFVEAQAPGNDCFLSIATVADTCSRVDRTIRLNVQELKARRLLEVRVEQKLLRQPDGTHKTKAVLVKDFRGLYALAHEYYYWSKCAEYIEPERDLIDAVRTNEQLMKKLLRFNNYRRLLLCQVPGPKPTAKPEHEWYTSYAADGTQGNTERAEAVQSDGIHIDRKEQLPEKLSDELSKDSQERITPNAYSDLLYRDSFRSEPASKQGGYGYTKIHDGQTTCEQVRDAHSEPTKTNTTNLSLSTSQETSAAESGNEIQKECKKRERADLDRRKQDFVEQAMGFARESSEKRHQQSTQRVQPNPLVSAFVREVSPLFNDKNGKSSLTRALRAVEPLHLTQKDILACLVKAYQVTVETKKVQPQHCYPDGDNKMPLFCTMFTRFVQQRADGSFVYSDEHLAQEIAADDRLVLFVLEHRLDKLLLDEQSASTGRENATEMQNDVQEAREEACDVEGSHPDVREDGELDNQGAEQPSQSLCIEVESPDVGWQTEESAWWWSQKLREALGRDRYTCQVYPTQYERFGIVLKAHEHPDEYWTFLTQEEVRQYL